MVARLGKNRNLKSSLSRQGEPTGNRNGGVDGDGGLEIPMGGFTYTWDGGKKRVRRTCGIGTWRQEERTFIERTGDKVRTTFFSLEKRENRQGNWVR